MAAVDCLVLDFDGTLSDVDSEGPRYLTMYRQALAERVGADLTRPWSEQQAHVLANADRYGWEIDGKIVAPAHADPYILAGCVARVVLGELGLLPDLAERGAVLQELYVTLYPRVVAAWRSEIGAFFAQLERAGRSVFVVTNANPDSVRGKLATLDSPFASKVPVCGAAKKFMLAPPATQLGRYDALPETHTVEGLTRPIYLKRGHYLETLEGIWKECGAGPTSTLVCGDIYEMDLAMPSAVGVQTHLVTRPGTRQWEKRGTLAQGGTLGASLLDVVARLDR
jgi:phosphoglycolate phosphatase-like HAD superfamily hydrolase